MAKSVRLRDIAEKVGVSTVTVSKALSGQKGMSDALREKIHSLASEMGYVPSISRKADNSKKSYNIGVIIAEQYMSEYSSYYNKLHQLVSQLAMDRGCFTMLEVISDKAQSDKQLPRLVMDKKVEGILVIGRLNEDYLKEIKINSGIPMVYLDFCNHTGDEDAVIADSYNGSYCITNYLFDKGHKKIAFVGTVMASGAITDRYFGYRKSLLEHGVEYRQDWIIDDRDSSNGAIDSSRFFRLPDDMPSAFVCNCDLTASVLIKKLLDKGYKVPEDISVVGFDNFVYPGMCDIKITTYGVDSYGMGRNAVLNLIRKISKERYRQGIMILEGHLIEGESVKEI